MDTLRQQPDLVFAVLALVLFLSSAGRTAANRRRWLRQPASRCTGGWKPCTVSLGLSTVGALCLACAVALGLPLLIEGMRPRTAQILAGSLLAGAVMEVIGGVRWPQARRSGKAAVVAAAGVALCGLAALGAVWYVRSTPPGAVPVAWPVEGRWRAVTGGRTRFTNYHHGNPAAQNYACDIVHIDGPEATEGQPVRAPISARVSRVVANWQDAADASSDGNMVVLDFAGTGIVFAHLQEGSVAVSEGDTVAPGQLLGRVGSTGSATVPHLHIHAERNGAAVPLVFGPKRRFLLRGDVVPR